MDTNTIFDDARLPENVEAQPVVQAAAALKPELRQYQEQLEREQRLPKPPPPSWPASGGWLRRLHNHRQLLPRGCLRGRGRRPGKTRQLNRQALPGIEQVARQLAEERHPGPNLLRHPLRGGEDKIRTGHG